MPPCRRSRGSGLRGEAHEAPRRALPGEATARFAHRRVRTTAKGAGQRPIPASAVPPELGCVAPWIPHWKRVDSKDKRSCPCRPGSPTQGLSTSGPPQEAVRVNWMPRTLGTGSAERPGQGETPVRESAPFGVSPVTFDYEGDSAGRAWSWTCASLRCSFSTSRCGMCTWSSAG